MLSVKNVTKQYSTGKMALRGVSLDVHHGEIIGLLGVNGAGKSTLSSIIATLHPATSGEILFNGRDIYKNLIPYRQAIGFCPQKPNLNALLTLEENLLFAGRFYGLAEKNTRSRTDELMQQFKLTEYAHQQAAVLSGGYKQRFMIARSLIHEPKLLILDEPTIALDPHVRHELWDFIKKLKSEGITILLTTHYLDEAEELSDRVVILHQGLISLIDKPEKLKADFKKGNLEEVFLQLMNQQAE
jgi:ABC-2 type transport system ATP-binding protein